MTSKKDGSSEIDKELLEQTPSKHQGVAVSELRLVEALRYEDEKNPGKAERVVEQSSTRHTTKPTS